MDSTCGRGYITDGRQCIDEDECKYEDKICGEDADCYNTLGSYFCHCQKGFTPPGNFTQDTSKICQDINECREYSIDCGPNASCQNYGGYYSCSCDTGYYPNNGGKTFIVGQGVQCIADICYTDKSICGEGLCKNGKDGHECVCKPGFTNYGRKQMKCTVEGIFDKSISGGKICTKRKAAAVKMTHSTKISAVLSVLVLIMWE
nr:adhesion G protein-coupled receptor E2 [Misgurnus anguillicaudatus]